MRYIRLTLLGVLATGVIVFVRLGLWVTKYQNLRRILIRPCPQQADEAKLHTVARIVRTIDRFARFIPDASCLTKTISCQAILSWKGIPSTIFIGARKGEDGALLAHAWLIWNDQVILEGDQLTAQNFSKLLELPTPRTQASSV